MHLVQSIQHILLQVGESLVNCLIGHFLSHINLLMDAICDRLNSKKKTALREIAFTFLALSVSSCWRQLAICA